MGKKNQQEYVNAFSILTNDSVNDKHYVLISDGWVGRKLEWVEGMLLSSFRFFFFFKFKEALEPKREACLKLMADMNYC